MKLAFDAPCINASVDYRVITEEPDARWLKEQADANLHQTLGEDQVKKVKRAGEWAGLEAEEIAHVRAELDAMWVELAKIGNLSMDDIEERRRAIVTEVETRRRYLWWRNYKVVVDEQPRGSRCRRGTSSSSVMPATTTTWTNLRSTSASRKPRMSSLPRSIPSSRQSSRRCWTASPL